MPRVQAHLIKRALSKKHEKDFFLTEVKNGPTHMARRGDLLILDALAIKRSWAQPRIIGYEIKVSRSDFNSDDKWPGYLQYCHHFSFVCPKGLIKPEELPEDVGLIYYDPEKETLNTRRKAAFRDIAMNPDLLWYIIICRLDNDRHPFFSSDREYYEEWVADKIKRRRLGYSVGTKLEHELEKAIEEKKEAERLYERYKSDAQTLREIEAIAREAGIFTWDLVKGIKEALQGGVNVRIKNKVDAIIREAEILKNMVQ